MLHFACCAEGPVTTAASVTQQSSSATPQQTSSATPQQSSSATPQPSTSAAAARPPPTADHPAAKRQKMDTKPKDKAPAWFAEFAAEQQKVKQELIQLNREVLEVAAERNRILKSLVDVLSKK